MRHYAFDGRISQGKRNITASSVFKTNTVRFSGGIEPNGMNDICRAKGHGYIDATPVGVGLAWVSDTQGSGLAPATLGFGTESLRDSRGRETGRPN